MNAIDGRIALSDIYEAKYGIYNHFGSGRALASVGWNEAEDVSTYSILEDMVRAFLLHKIKDVYGYNLSEFLELPMDIIEMLIKLSQEELGKKNSAMDKLEQEFKGR